MRFRLANCPVEERLAFVAGLSNCCTRATLDVEFRIGRLFSRVVLHAVFCACEAFRGGGGRDLGSEYSELHKFTTSRHFCAREVWELRSE